MATTAPKRQSASRNASPTRRARAKAGKPKASPQAARKKGSAAKSKTKVAATVAKKAAPGGGSVTSKLARTAAKKGLKRVARAAVRASGRALQAVAAGGGDLGRNTLESALSKRLPIQVSVDVAAPLEFVWDEWMQSGRLPEGVHRVEEIERNGALLTGTIAGPLSADWEAEILDEREHESFAWRSTEGSDCAGLVTFHRLSDRLTRIELDLDVLPTNPAEALTLSLHVAHRHAEADLRRFKARVEFISPDVYESNGQRDGSALDDDTDQ